MKSFVVRQIIFSYDNCHVMIGGGEKMSLLIKIVFLLIGIGMDTSNGNRTKIVILLIMISISALIEWQNSLKSRVVYFTMYCILIVVNPTSILYLPLVIYDLNINPIYYNAFFLPLLFIYPSWMIALFSVLAIVTKHRFNQAQYWHQNYFHLLDQSDSKLADLKAAADMQLTLQEQSVMIAINQERSHIAREIHDHVGHVLSSSIIQLGAIEVINQDELLTQPISKLQTTLSQGMEAIRNSVHHLYDKGFDLESQLNDLKESTKLHISYEMSRISQLPDAYHYDLYMMIKEAINNAHKHSNGNHLRIKLKVFPHFYQLTIQDDGHLTSSIIHEGVGLKSIQDRVSKWHGVCRIITDKGFKLHIVLPKEEEHESTHR